MFEVSPQGLGHSILRNFVSRVSTVEFVPPFPKPSSRDMNVCLCGSAGDHCGVVLCKTPEAHILFRGAEKVCVCVSCGTSADALRKDSTCTTKKSKVIVYGVNVFRVQVTKVEFILCVDMCWCCECGFSTLLCSLTPLSQCPERTACEHKKTPQTLP